MFILTCAYTNIQMYYHTCIKFNRGINNLIEMKESITLR